MKKFLVRIADKPIDKFDPAEFFTVKADSFTNAALSGINRVFKRNGKPTVKTTVHADVADKSWPRHPTGVPMAIHSFEIVLHPDA
jgi:hypothetical protein